MDPVPPKSRDRAPTIRDVARHAKVGVGTVSRVLNDSPLVSEEARRRVHRTFDVETLAQRDAAFANFARTDRVDGLLVMSLRPTDDEVERLRRESLPVVLVDVVHPELPR